MTESGASEALLQPFATSAEPGANPVRDDQLTEQVKARLGTVANVPAGVRATLWSGLRNRAVDDTEHTVLVVEHAGCAAIVVLQLRPPTILSRSPSGKYKRCRTHSRDPA